MPVNVPAVNLMEDADLEGTDWILISRRDETSRGLKNKGVVYGEWFIPFEDFVNAVAGAIVSADDFGDIVDAVVADLGDYAEPDWVVV